MQKRAIGSVLWFAAVWLTYEVVWSLTGVPRTIGPVLGAAVAILVTLDPTGWFWNRSASQRARAATPLVPVTAGRAEQQTS
jgi:hypothetical protein